MKSLSAMNESATSLPQTNQLEHYEGNLFNVNLTGFDDYEKVFIAIMKGNQKTIMFSFARTKVPPENFPEKTYAFIRYLDAMGVEKYRYEFIKSNKGISPPQARVFFLTPQGGERLFIYHKEGGERFQFENAQENKSVPIEMKEVEITYQFTGDGLLRLPSDSPAALTLSDSLVHPLPRALATYATPSEILYSPEKLSGRAIAAPLSQSERPNISEKYSSLLPQTNNPERYVGNLFSVHLTGFDNYERMFIDINKHQKTVLFSFSRIKLPPEHFPEKTYALVRYLDAMGIEKYRYDFIKSNKDIHPPQAKLFFLTPQGGERLFIYHKEGGERFKFSDLQEHKNIPIEMKEVEITYQFTSDGLQRLPNDSPEHLTLADSAIQPLTQALASSTISSENFCPLEDFRNRAIAAAELLASPDNSLFNRPQNC